MILVKYITKEICKNQLIILVILFLICLCQKFLKMLNLVAHENISVYFIFLCIGLNIPELGKLIIPFSAFISVPITFYRLHMHNEILAMYVCSVNKYVFIKSILFFSAVILIFSIINMSWLSPYCGYYQNKLLFKIYKDIDLMMLTEKKFQLLNNKRLVLFIDNIQNKELNNIFLIQKDKDMLTVVIANQANIHYVSDETTLVMLERGTCYEIYNRKKLYEDIFLSKFFHYQIYLDCNVKILRLKNEINYMSWLQLWNSYAYEARLELHWRFTLLISIVITSIISTLLFINIVPNYFILAIFIVFLYVIFFLLHVLLRFYIFLELSNPIVWMWGCNIFYCIIAGILNVWNSFYIKEMYLKIQRYFHIKI